MRNIVGLKISNNMIMLKLHLKKYVTDDNMFT